METNILTSVHGILHGVKRGHDYHANCPFCEKPAAARQTHFSYALHGYKCFVCGQGGSLFALAKILNLGVTAVTVTQPPARKVAQPHPHDNEFVTRYAAHPHRVALWQADKPVDEETILGHNLGVGVLPRSQCRHERLILPIYNEAGRVVCLRGRRLNCDCPKWLASGGWVMADLPFYNLAALRTGGVLWIVENPVDALMVGQFSPYTGAATLSVSYWQKTWAEALVAKKPSLVVVAFDNDLPGNGGAWRREEFVREWPGARIPEARGVKLVNTLLAHGIKATLYDWKDAKHKADIGSLLSEAR